MDLYDSDDVSSESSDDHQLNGVGLPEGAANAQDDTGRRAELRLFSGQCIGDDVTWVGSKVTRVVAVQSGGTGANRQHWGIFWGRGLWDLGSGIGTVAETRIHTETACAAACRGTGVC